MEDATEKQLLKYVAKNIYGLEFSAQRSEKEIREVLERIQKYDDITGRANRGAAAILSMAGQEIDRESILAVAEKLDNSEDMKLIADMIATHDIQEIPDPLSNFPDEFLDRTLFSAIGGRDKLRNVADNILRLEGQTDSSGEIGIQPEKRPIIPPRNLSITNLQLTPITLIPRIREYARNPNNWVLRDSIIQKIPTVKFTPKGQTELDVIDFRLYIYFEAFLTNQMEETEGEEKGKELFYRDMVNMGYEYNLVTPYSDGKKVRWYNPDFPFGPKPLNKAKQVALLEEYISEKEREKERRTRERRTRVERTRTEREPLTKREQKDIDTQQSLARKVREGKI